MSRVAGIGGVVSTQPVNMARVVILTDGRRVERKYDPTVGYEQYFDENGEVVPNVFPAKNRPRIIFMDNGRRIELRHIQQINGELYVGEDGDIVDSSKVVEALETDPKQLAINRLVRNEDPIEVGV